MRPVPLECLVVVFPVYGVAHIVAFILDSPVISGVPVQVSGSFLLRSQLLKSAIEGE